MRGPVSEAKRVLVIGELNVDMIVSGLASLPVLGHEILAEDCVTVLGSSSAICAAGMARLGVQVGFVGKVGADDRGRFVRGALDRLGVRTQHLITDPRHSTGITISLSLPVDRAMVTILGCIQELRVEDVDIRVLGEYRHLHVGSYYLQRGLQSGLTQLIDVAHEAGMTVSLDTGCDPLGRWHDGRILDVIRLVDIFMPNEMEACAIAQVDSVDAALDRLSDLGPLVVVKLGAEGAITRWDGDVLHSPAFPVEVVDTTGAGDSFDAGFIYSYVVRDLPISAALQYANGCGALSTQGYGGTAAQPQLRELEAFLTARSGTDAPVA
ncbi:MAG: carbohydrate kinase family protein [Chloroflexi bacterium]|nr:carbohydrate kinase family protein [Chloroflexota bacterium]